MEWEETTEVPSHNPEDGGTTIEVPSHNPEDGGTTIEVPSHNPEDGDEDSIHFTCSQDMWNSIADLLFQHNDDDDFK